MTGSEQVDAVLDRVLAARPWVAEDTTRAGRGRYARVFKYAGRVSLQVLYTKAIGSTPDSLEVALAFDDNDRSANTSNVEEYREQLGENETKLGLKLRDGEGGICYYLSRFIPLVPDPLAAYEQATELCLGILDLALGGRSVSAGYRTARDEDAKRRGGER